MFATEKAMPGLHQLLLVFSDNLFDSSKFLSVESPGTNQGDVSEPELRNTTVPSNMDMRWFSQLISIKEEPIRADNLDRG
jgi:hypothetical protein